MTARHRLPRSGAGPADPGLAARKARDGALAVPLIGLILMMPPVAQIFAVDGRIAGVPVVVGYIFGVWLLLVIGARIAGRRILATETMPEPRAGPGAMRDGNAAAGTDA